MESAILLTVPEAEPLVGHWRERGDPSAAVGVPAHVTLLYPFVSDPDVGIVEELRWFFRGVDGFPLTFSAIGQFPQVVYLAPDQADECHQLTAALARRWPSCPPYDGEFSVAEVVPHLTVVDSEDEQLRSRACVEVQRGLPVRSTARQAALWVSGEGGRWSELAVFPLAAGE